ncbi:MAG: O-antigen ligase family protein [Clostridia bacterium]|nr:O-antigen ligase family protein [Clostridia bacterium]
MTAFDTDLTLGTRRPHILVTISQACSRFFLNRYVLLAIFCAAFLVVALEKEVLGAFLFVSLICLTLILCEDILASALPFLLLCVFISNCYDSYDTFIRYAWMAIPAAIALIFHFTVYRRPFRLGSTFPGLCAVSVALLLGGVGFISPSDYFRPGALFYTLSLGVGMVVLYLLLKSQLSVKRDYDVKEKCITLLYLMGAFAALWVLFFLFKNLELLRSTKQIPYMQPSNNMSTFLMLALPCPFFFVPRNRMHLLGALALLAALILTGSRAGAVLGAVEFLLCLAVSAVWDKPRRFFYVCCSIAFVGLIWLCGNQILQFTTAENLKTLISQEEPRYQLLSRAKDLFLANPLFGHGIGYVGNHDLYAPTKGALEWYHMMIPQVVGSMGILGILAYGYQLVMQGWCGILAIRREPSEGRAAPVTLLMCFVGVLLMSQLNPGLFCPLPYGLLATVIFALLDGDRLLPKKSEQACNTK